jgi:hypothetical protein
MISVPSLHGEPMFALLSSENVLPIHGIQKELVEDIPCVLDGQGQHLRDE